MEIERSWYGFHYWFAMYSERVYLIWVIVDRLTKVAHFLPDKTTYTSTKLAELYMERIVSLHGVSKKIMSDRGTRFTSHY
jgi:hypothetical protein